MSSNCKNSQVSTFKRLDYKSSNVEPEERLKMAQDIYDTFVMRELLVRQNKSRKDSTVTQSPDYGLKTCQNSFSNNKFSKLNLTWQFLSYSRFISPSSENAYFS